MRRAERESALLINGLHLYFAVYSAFSEHINSMKAKRVPASFIY